MGSQLDQDQGGTQRQTQRVYLGPSVGWIYAPSSVVLDVKVTGTTTILLGTCLVKVNFNGSVTLQLPLAKANAAGAQAVPGTFVSVPIVIVDIGGFATANPITILPAGAELIDGQASILLNSNYGAFTLQPDVVNGGWTLIQ